jgi:hypothetical protein
MKYWERLSKTIFKFAARPLIRKIQPKSIETVLRDSLVLLNEETNGDIRVFVKQKQTAEGGFVDRAGKNDLYYSLFGYFIAEAFSLKEVLESLKVFVKAEITSKDLKGVPLFCAAILYSKLFKTDRTSLKLSEKIKLELKSSDQHIQYSSFMGFLALYYLEDFFTLKNLLKTFEAGSSLHQQISKSAHQHINTSVHQRISTSAHLPCPVTAANAILRELTGKPDHFSEVKIKSFYRNNGGFAALLNTPAEDLLSTGIALYALKFINADLRLIKPDCLSFVDDLYSEGGFRATQLDFETDIEYTFYGLLALGSLK